MSTVALLVNDLGSQSAKSTSLLMNAFGLNIGTVRNAITGGVPLIEKKLFDRKDPMFPQKLLGILCDLDALGAKWTAIELLDGQEYSPGDARYEITADRLRNMIRAREESLEGLRRLGELEDDAE